MPAGAGSAGDTSPGNVLGGWGSGLNFNWEGVFGLNLPNFITIADLGLPVGLGGVPILQSGVSLPAPDAELVTLEREDAAEQRHEFISDEIDRRDVASDEAELQDVAWSPDYAVSAPALVQNTGSIGSGVLTDQEWLNVMYPGEGRIANVQPATPTAQIVATQENDVGWISDVYSAVDTSLGGWLPGGVPVGASIPQTAFNFPTAAPPGPVVVAQAPAAYPTPPMPPGGVVMAGCDNDPMKGMVWKKHCGEWRWVKQKRRRRRAIVSQQDLKGLAALKGILGMGKAMDVWIATHS